VKEKLVLLSIGTVATGFVSVLAFLILSYLGTFPTKAEFKDHIIEETSFKSEIKTELKYIRSDLREIKHKLRGK
jgi:hypothetical protein